MAHVSRGMTSPAKASVGMSHELWRLLEGLAIVMLAPNGSTQASPELLPTTILARNLPHVSPYIAESTVRKQHPVPKRTQTLKAIRLGATVGAIQLFPRTPNPKPKQ